MAARRSREEQHSMAAFCPLPVVDSLPAPPRPRPRTQAEEELLPPYTSAEWIRELRQRLVLLRWRAQRLRARSK
jgi:hypothetical protein